MSIYLYRGSFLTKVVLLFSANRSSFDVNWRIFKSLFNSKRFIKPWIKIAFFSKYLNLSLLACLYTLPVWLCITNELSDFLIREHIFHQPSSIALPSLNSQVTILWIALVEHYRIRHWLFLITWSPALLFISKFENFQNLCDLLSVQVQKSFMILSRFSW